jgi:hypothetical protein
VRCAHGGLAEDHGRAAKGRERPHNHHVRGRHRCTRAHLVKLTQRWHTSIASGSSTCTSLVASTVRDYGSRISCNALRKGGRRRTPRSPTPAPTVSLRRGVFVWCVTGADGRGRCDLAPPSGRSPRPELAALASGARWQRGSCCQDTITPGPGRGPSQPWDEPASRQDRGRPPAYFFGHRRAGTRTFGRR